MLCLPLPLLRSLLLWGCGDVSTEAELTGPREAMVTEQPQPLGDLGSTSTSPLPEGHWAGLTGSAGANAGPRGVCKHPRAPAQTECFGMATWGRPSEDNS